MLSFESGTDNYRRHYHYTFIDGSPLQNLSPVRRPMTATVDLVAKYTQPEVLMENVPDVRGNVAAIFIALSEL